MFSSLHPLPPGLMGVLSFPLKSTAGTVTAANIYNARILNGLSTKRIYEATYGVMLLTLLTG